MQTILCVNNSEKQAGAELCQAQISLSWHYLVASQLILTQVSYDDTAYYTQFSCKAELQPKNKLLRVGGATGEMRNKAKFSLNRVQPGLWLSKAINNPPPTQPTKPSQCNAKPHAELECKTRLIFHLIITLKRITSKKLCQGRVEKSN